MELRHLRYFVAVAETLNFSRAAERLNLTQPALSRQIRDLEGDLGVVLFRRQGSSTSLTLAGRRFFGRAREILDLAARAAAEAKDVAASVRLGHYGTLWVDYFGPALRAFAKNSREVVLHAVEQTPVELLASLRRGEVDVALIGPATPEIQKEFEVKRLGILPALVAMGTSHPLAKKRKVSLDELRDSPWIVWDEKEFPGRVTPLRDAAKCAGFEPRIEGKADSVGSLFVRLANSKAAGYVLPMSRKLPHAGVVFSELRSPGISFPMDVVWRRETQQHAAVRELVRLLATVPTSR
jgi:DNA-binding transcriptional LysR family regulator